MRRTTFGFVPIVFAWRRRSHSSLVHFTALIRVLRGWNAG
ncbi:hypothetical protein PJE062_995 [Pseudovibrio sp. JE062]|nr:hypothetical protein PJE062_995 [Pseudovibrio sp. JE062]